MLVIPLEPIVYCLVPPSVKGEAIVAKLRPATVRSAAKSGARLTLPAKVRKSPVRGLVLVFQFVPFEIKEVVPPPSHTNVAATAVLVGTNMLRVRQAKYNGNGNGR